MPQVSNIFSNQIHRGPSWVRSQESLDQIAARTRAAINKANGMHLQPRAIRHSRDAMVVTTVNWERSQTMIPLFVNPSDMRWSLPRRGTVVKTQGGTVRNVWRNRYRGTYFDEGTVGITFQTGNIMPSAAYDPSELRTVADIAAAVGEPRVPPGLSDFYMFMSLLDQPMLLNARPNYHRIYHHSRVFPNIMLEGFFTDDSFSFAEAVTDGNKLQWEATFQIYRTVPRFQSWEALSMAYTNFITRHYDEQLGQKNVTAYLYAEGVDDHGKVPPAGKPKNKISSSTQSPFDGSVSGLTNIAAASNKRDNISDAADKFRKNLGSDFVGTFFDPS